MTNQDQSSTHRSHLANEKLGSERCACMNGARSATPESNRDSQPTFNLAIDAT